MRRGILLLIAFLSIVSTVQAQEHSEPRTRWISLDSSKPITFKEWQSTRKKEKWQVQQVYPLFKQNSDCAIIVETGLYDSVQTEVNQLKSDLESEGQSVTISKASGGTPSDLRDYLKSISGLKGVLFIGELPIAWFQLVYGYIGYEEFPCDFYFMDLDGTWSDDYMESNKELVPGSDDIFDGHTGSTAPEIFVGRLLAAPFDNRVSLLKNYFSKDHKYRTGLIRLPDTAIVYIDDEWVSYYGPNLSHVNLLYPYVELITDENTTSAFDYKARLEQRGVRAWISLFAHSTPLYHVFLANNRPSGFYCSNVPGIDPDAFFYNLYCCSNCRYVEEGYGGGRYLFTKTYGLGVIGSTKAGAMREHREFYQALGNKATMGEAYKQWFIARSPYSAFDRSWYYGLTLLGDPWLKPTGHKIGVSEESSSIAFSLGQIIPSPGLREIRINYELPAGTNVNISIYDVSGRVIRSLVDGYQSPGRKSIIWDRRSINGNLVPGGVYFCHLKAVGFSEMQKIVLLGL